MSKKSISQPPEDMPPEVDASLIHTRVQFLNTSVNTTLERRRYPRIEILGRVRGTVRPLNVPITLLNVSLGGFLMQTPMQYQIGETHEFQFTMGREDPIVVRARIAHAMRVTVDHGPLFLYGLEFVDAGVRGNVSAIESLVSALQDQHGSKAEH